MGRKRREKNRIRLMTFLIIAGIGIGIAASIQERQTGELSVPLIIMAGACILGGGMAGMSLFSD